MLDLGKIRDEIDATDDEIVRLFQHRMALTAEVAQYKIPALSQKQTELSDAARQFLPPEGIYGAMEPATALMGMV